MQLTVLDSKPSGLLDVAAAELYQKLSGPTLIHLKGQREPAVFVSVLLHGNEHTGWEAVRKLLTHYENIALPRSLSLFIGNVEAARYNQRFLDHQVDFNRVWGTSEHAAHPLMRQVIEEMKTRGIFVSVDVHNNTGKNPHYACVNQIKNSFLHLARLFSRTMVYFIRPEGVQSMAFAKICPAVTVECGLSGAQLGIDHVYEFINACLHLKSLPDQPLDRRDIDLYHTIAVAKVTPGYSFGFDDGEYDILLDKNIEYYNFRQLPQDSTLGWVRDGIACPLDIRDERGNAITDEYLEVVDNQIKTKKIIIPAMITLNTEVIRQDCLCYVMEHYPLDKIN